MAFPAAPTVPVYRKTKQGDFVIFGPSDQIQIGPVTVHLKSGATKKTHILSVGAVFDVESGPCRYGYQTVAVSEVANTVAAFGTSKLTEPSTAKINLDASDFMPDSAFDSENDVPASYDQFSGESPYEHSNTDQSTSAYDMPPHTEAFAEQFA